MKELTKSIHQFNSSDLTMKLVNESDAAFIIELLNTEGWIKYIGDRKIITTEDALNYIKKLTDSNNICYWTVSLKSNNQKIGFVTLIKRNEYDQPDIGFAFLPSEIGKGFAYQATDALIKKLSALQVADSFIAITLPENEKSIKLLLRLGFQYHREQIDPTEILHVYKTNLIQQ